MNSESRLLHDLYGDTLDYEYHQNHLGGVAQWLESPSIIAAFVAIFLGLVYTLFHVLDYNLLSLPELLWNILVFITPSRLLDILDHELTFTSAMDPRLHTICRTHAAKSDLLRRLLGFNSASSLVGSVAQAGRRRLSSLSGINMASKGAEERPPGLGNWDNSCYQNSVLQGLASLDSLPNYLADSFSRETDSQEADNTDMKMAQSLKELITRLTDPSNNGTRIWTPPVLKSMSSWQQQDAQEYFSKVLDEIDKEIAKASAKVKSEMGLNSDRLCEDRAGNLNEVENEELASNQIIQNPLEGLIAQRVGCTRCGYADGLSLIPFNCLTVPLGKSWSYDIAECLDEYTKLEAIEGVECGKCTLEKTQNLLKVIMDRVKDTPYDDSVKVSTASRLKIVSEALENDDYDDKTLTQKCKIPPRNRVSTTKSRQAVVARPPKSLVIHVNRSVFDEMTGELKKNYAEVKFTKKLDLGRWCLGSSGSSEDDPSEEWVLDPARTMIAGKDGRSRVRGPMYELRAVVTHYGRHENGHYIAYRKHPMLQSLEQKVSDPGWWRLSDDDVTRVSEETVLGQGGVFMLFYDCVEPAVSNLLDGQATGDSILASYSQEVAIAAGIPLPEDDEGSLDPSGLDDAKSVDLSRDPSITTSIADDEQLLELPGYQSAKPIIVPQYLPSSGSYLHGKGKNKDELTGRGNMVMV